MGLARFITRKINWVEQNGCNTKLIVKVYWVVLLPLLHPF